MKLREHTDDSLHSFEARVSQDLQVALSPHCLRAVRAGFGDQEYPGGLGDESSNVLKCGIMLTNLLAGQFSTVDGRNPANHLGCITPWINYLSTGAGFLPSTVGS